MNSPFHLMRQAIVPLLLLFSLSYTNAQKADYNQLTIIDFHNRYYDNVIDTAGNVLFEEEWTFILRLPECEKFFGIRMLSDAPEGHLPTFDMIPAEYAILSPDGSKIILDYREISGFDYAPPFTVRTDEGWGLIDCNNEWLTEPAYFFEPPIREHYMLLVGSYFDSLTAEHGLDWENLGIADFNGNVIAETQYTDIYSFFWWKDPLYVVMKGNRSSLLDSRGKVLIPMGDYYLFPSLTDESVWVINDNEERVYFPDRDEWVTENTQDLMRGLYGCQNGFRIIGIEENHHFAEWNCIDGSAGIYADLESIRQSFINPYRRIEKDGKYGVISKYGDTILPCIYNNIYEEYNQEIHEHNIMQCVFEGMISVEIDGYWGLVDTSGRYHTHFVYDELLAVSEGIVAAKVEGRTGFIDIQGNSIIPFVFDNSEKTWNNGVGWALLGDEQILINKNGEIIANESGTVVPFTLNDLKDEEQIPRSEYWLLNRMDENGDLMTEDTYLDPSGVGLTYIPDEIALFPDLEELEISDNYISRIDFDFTQFPKLDRIGLGGNLIEEFPESLLELNLSALDLNNNKIWQLPPDLFHNKSLEEIWLDNNLITSLPPLTNRNNNLKLLFLADNRIEHLPEDMSQFKSLQTIDLSNNQLKSVPESLLKLKKLQYLILEGNPIPREELERIAELRPDLEL